MRLRGHNYLEITAVLTDKVGYTPSCKGNTTRSIEIQADLALIRQTVQMIHEEVKYFRMHLSLKTPPVANEIGDDVSMPYPL